MSAVPYLNTSSSYSLEKWIANDDFQQDLCSRTLPFCGIYSKTAWRNLPESKEFHIERHCQTYQPTSGRNFEHLL
ncbi:hypothetical protein TNCV_2851601 [Trichonephila clavipes]|nr:hypothetical protein TNCV_2851601 [Trichonephila clavipes]